MTLSGLGLLTMWELPRRVSYFVSNFLQNYFRCLILSWVPLHFLPSKPSFLYDHFTTQHSDFSSFLAVSTTDKPCLCSHVAGSFCVNGVYLSWYSQKTRKELEQFRNKMQKVCGWKVYSRTRTFCPEVHKSKLRFNPRKFCQYSCDKLNEIE